MNYVKIYSATNITPPFSGTACDVYGNQCSYVGSGSTFSVTFTLPSQFNTAPALQLTLTDSIGCSVSEIIYCSPFPIVGPPKQFQNLDYFYFMSGDLYEFQ
jgi:hypothetical protein